jgi:MFS family permease
VNAAAPTLETDELQRGGRLQRRTVAVLAAATILGGLGVGASLSVGALLLAEVSGNDAISGLGSAMFNAGAAVAGIPLARVAARHGRRRALVTGSAIAMLGAVVAIYSTVVVQWWLLAVGIAMLGVASSVQLMSRFAATDLALPKNRARDLSLVAWAITVGAVVGPNLMGPGAVVGEALGVTPLAGVFAFPFVAQILAVLVNWFGLRPDPLLTARRLPPETDSVPTVPAAPVESGGATAVVDGASRAGSRRAGSGSRSAPRSNRPQVLTVFMIAMAQAIMVAIMAMTPLHLMHHEGTPHLVGVTLSLHIAGMYALSPVFGVLAGRIGRLQVIGIGWAMLLGAVALAYFAGPSHALVQIALVLLGLGWGAITVAGAALLTEVTPSADRPRWQGRSDTIMSAAGAIAGALSGVVFAIGDFSFLALVSGGLLALGALAMLWVRR